MCLFSRSRSKTSKRKYFFIKFITKLWNLVPHEWILHGGQAVQEILNLLTARAVMFAEKDQSVLTLFLPCPLSINYWLELEAGFRHFSLTQDGSFYFSVPRIMCAESVKGMGNICDSIFFLFLYYPLVSSPEMVLVLKKAKQALQEALEGML